MEVGNCHLCGLEKELQASHVWPKFAYRRYVADVNKGGQFTDLQQLRRHSRQVKYHWFCRDCELMFGESCAAEFLANVESSASDQFGYQADMLRFAVSISWRTAKYYEPRAKTLEAANLLKNPCRRWRNYLLRGKGDLRPFSQHCFIAQNEPLPGTDAMSHNPLGGEVFLRERLISSRIGPLLIVGLLDRHQLERCDIDLWEQSLVSGQGGVVHRIRKERVEPMLTDDMVEVLNRYEQNCVRRHAKMLR